MGFSHTLAYGTFGGLVKASQRRCNLLNYREVGPRSAAQEAICMTPTPSNCPPKPRSAAKKSNCRT